MTDNQLADAAVARMYAAALARPELSALRDMLLTIAKEVNAHGCVLWEVRPKAEIGTPETAAGEMTFPRDATLSVVAEGFPDDVVCPYHKLPLMTSATGRAVRQGKVNVPNAQEDPGVDKTTAFLVKTNTRSLCAVRVMLDHTVGALTFYRQRVGLFNQTEIELIQRLAKHVPTAYRTVRERVSLKLIESVTSILRGEESSDIRSVMDQLCRAIADWRQCLEATVYLEDRAAKPGVLQLMATTCKQLIRMEAYSGDRQGGLTRWVISKREPLHIPTLTDFDAKELGLVWTDTNALQTKARELLRIAVDEEVPPLSFMAVPVMAAGQTVGVLRCSIAHKPPYYFGERDLKLLEIIGSQLAQYWHGVIRRQELGNEVTLWDTFVKNLSDLNAFAQPELTKSGADIPSILDRGLQTAESVIPNARDLYICQFDPETRHVVPSIVRQSGKRSEINAELRRTLSQPVDESPPKSAVAHIYKNRKVLTTSSRVSSDPEAAQSAPDTIVAPMMADSGFLGILCIICEERLPRTARPMVELLTQQLALYLRLAQNIEQQTQIYQDLHHQLRSPIFQAYKRAWTIVGATQQANVDAVRGLLGKARKVVTNLKIYANIAVGHKIEADLTIWRISDLVKLLLEAAMDNRVLYKSRGISFYVQRDEFERLSRMAIKVDTNLFEQAISNLFDNAGKYGFANTEVFISGALTLDQQFVLSIKNQGTLLTAEDACHARERGWRGKYAQDDTGEGSGIGLWIVDHIMRAHDGALKIVPTDDGGFADFQLIFPSQRLRTNL